MCIKFEKENRNLKILNYRKKKLMKIVHERQFNHFILTKNDSIDNRRSNAIIFQNKIFMHRVMTR